MRTTSVCICIVLATVRISLAQDAATEIPETQIPETQIPETRGPETRGSGSSTLDAQDPNAILTASITARQAGDLARADTLAQQGVQHYPHHQGLWLAWIDNALRRGNPTAALERTAEAEKSLGSDPELAWRRGQAYAEMDCWVGATQRRKLPEAKLGQFVDERLVVKRLDRWGSVLLAGEDSAIHATRLALEGGLDRPEVHLLYARCWVNLGATAVAVAIVRRQLNRLEEQNDPQLLNQARTIAAEAGELDLLLDVAKLQAKRAKKNADPILATAHEQAADIAALRGEIELTYSLRKLAYELGPQAPGRRLRLADAAWDAGDRAVAVEHYRAILAEQPQHPERKRMQKRVAQVERPK